MSGFEQLPGAIQASASTEPLRADEVAFSGEALADAAALKLVVGDVILAEQYINSKRQPQAWENADNLYRAVVKTQPWPGTDVNRANLSMPVILEAVEKLLPTVYLAFFSDRQPFLIEPLGRTTPEVARADAKLLMWAVKESGFKEEIRKCLKSWLLYGFCVAKWGWKTVTKTRNKYKREGDSGSPIVKDPEKYDIAHPTLENVELRKVLFDPSLREHDGRKGRWVCSQMFTTGYGLDDLRDNPDYKNIPTREKLAEILSRREEPAVDSLQESKQLTHRDLQAQPERQDASVDPLAQPLELLEYVTEDRVITVLQRMIPIRNQVNEFDKINYLSCAFIDVPGSMYGFGVAKLLSGEQRLQVGVVNQFLDVLALQLNPSYQLRKGLGPGTQQIKTSPGKVINESGEMIPLPVPSVTKEAEEAIANSEQRATRRVGANGGDNVPTQALRTAEGVNSFNQSIVEKLQYEIELFSDLVFIPALEAFLDVCKSNLQPDDIQKILSDHDGKAYEGDILDVYNGTCQIQVLSSTKLAARRAAAQLVPMVMQLVQAPAVQASLTAQNKKFNYVEFLNETLTLAGWDIEALIQDASPQEVQQAMSMMPGVAAAQSAQAQAQAKVAGQIEVAEATAEAQGLARAGVKVISHVLDQSAKPLESAVPQNLLGA